MRLVVLVMMAAFAVCIKAKCEWTNGATNDVQCHLKILDFRRNSSSASMQVPAPGLGEAKQLKVFCSDVFFFESQLRSDHLGSLDALTDLEISFCKLRTLPPRTFVGLRGLKSLKINTHNEDWTSLQMEPDYETLVGLQSLDLLDMQLNNLHHIPPGFLCPLKNLRHIDFSFNAIKDLNFLGLSHAKEVKEEFRCSIPAQSLALRHNGLITVTPKALAALTSLKHIDLSYNAIDVLVEPTFQGLSNLETIDLSYNRLAAIPPRIFSSTPNLKSLVLDNNTLAAIDLDVFSNLTQLQTLNMSGNDLDENWIKPGIFSGLHSLVALDLSSNHISRLDPALLDDLNHLQVLNLADNKIHTIATNSFLHLTNLHTLNINHNQLESVQRHTFTGLSLLHVLNLDNNRLHTLHSGSLRNCSALTYLALSHNFLTQVPEAVHQSLSLQHLDLSSNLLGVLKRESLQGLPKLTTLKLGNNELSRLGEGTFVEVVGLQDLDLSRNRFLSMETDTLKELKDLRSLDLSQNQLEDVNGLFTMHQTALQMLNLSSNALLWFDYAFIPRSLEVLDIHSNNIDSLGNFYALRDYNNLKYIDASVNAISSLNVLSILPGVVEINLSNNIVSHIAPKTFTGKKHLTKVHLERNRLETLDTASLMVSLGPNNRPPQFFLAGNPLLCDCNLQWFHQMATTQLQLSDEVSLASSSMNQMYPEIPDLAQVTCRVLNTTDPSQFFRQTLTQLDEKDFLCSYKTHCLALCLCCDFLACDCKMKCPDECQCFHDQLWSANVVQCAHKNLRRVPSLVPMDVTELHLDGSNLTRLTQTMFMGRSRLKTIRAPRSNVYEVENGTFSGLDHLEVIHLAYNQLKQLFGYEFSGAVSLREIYLQNNQLVTIEAHTFKQLPQLTVLRLDGNLLIEFPIWELSSNKYLTSLTLSSNWWNCECNFVRKFRMFIDTLGNAVVKDANAIACNSDHDRRIGQSNCHASLSNHQIFVTDTRPTLTLPVILAIVLVCAALFIFVAIIICFKDKFRIWLYSRYGIRVEVAKAGRQRQNHDDANPILFDALVLYSNKDNEPYVAEFCHSLEPTYRLCLLHRDLSGIYTSEAFKSALEASKRHVVLLSRSFFATEWQHFQEHLPDYKKLILIKLDLDEAENAEEIEPDDATAKKFLSGSSSKVLSWSNKPKFWQSVRYYLPDPPRLLTKEGGAELDLSGVWSFSGEGLKQTAARPPLPMIKKKCSSTSINDSGVYDSELNQLARSCGTNTIHQRSSSALVETIRRAEGGHNNHQRSSSYYYPGTAAAASTVPQNIDYERPPTPPAKVGKMQRPGGGASSSYASPSSILMQLATVSPDLLSSLQLNSTMTTPLESNTPVTALQKQSTVKMMSPVVKAKMRESQLQQHQRSLSLVNQNCPTTPKSSVRFTTTNHVLRQPHRRSASVLEPSTASQNSISLQEPPSLVLSRSNSRLQPSISETRPHTVHHHSRSVSMLESSNRPVQPSVSGLQLKNLDSRKILNMSTSQLHHLASRKINPKQGVPYHQRSSSTPFNEGFVL